MTNYLKLQILASCNNLGIGQDSEFAEFWPSIKNVNIGHALTLDMPKKVFFESCIKIEWVCVTLLGSKACPHADHLKMKISFHLLRSLC